MSDDQSPLGDYRVISHAITLAMRCVPGVTEVCIVVKQAHNVDPPRSSHAEHTVIPIYLKLINPI